MFFHIHQFSAVMYYLWNLSDGISGTTLHARNLAFPSSRRGTSSGGITTDAQNSSDEVGITFPSLTLSFYALRGT